MSPSHHPSSPQTPTLLDYHSRGVFWSNKTPCIPSWHNFRFLVPPLPSICFQPHIQNWPLPAQFWDFVPNPPPLQHECMHIPPSPPPPPPPHLSLLNNPLSTQPQNEALTIILPQNEVFKTVQLQNEVFKPVTAHYQMFCNLKIIPDFVLDVQVQCFRLCTWILLHCMEKLGLVIKISMESP